MKFGMGVQTEILDCCGLHGLHRMPTTKEEFEEEVKKLCEDDFHFVNEDDDGYDNYGGAMVIISTSSDQINANEYLPELGWNKVFQSLNSNSGNTVYLWAMSMTEFNEKWGAY